MTVMIEKHLILQDPPNITVPVDGLLLSYPPYLLRIIESC